MRVSCIVPVRWSEPRVLTLLEALRAQLAAAGPAAPPAPDTGEAAGEIIAVVMDGGNGRDGGAGLLPDLERRARIIAAAPSTPAAVRNLAAAQAQGDFLVFIDDDCVPEAGWLDRLLAAATDPAVGAVAGGVLPAPAVTFTEKYLGAYGLPLPEDAAVYDRVLPFVSFGHSAN
ncbi:MAG TPA: glycosyltransferase family A protein, partial [bacterium]|nr:glycosyltransferase family A protein [bacterium]